jgi:hypothetical protein
METSIVQCEWHAICNSTTFGMNWIDLLYLTPWSRGQSVLRPSSRRGSNILEEFLEKLRCGVGWIKGVVLNCR